jgi:hypothetical protein
MTKSYKALVFGDVAPAMQGLPQLCWGRRWRCIAGATFPNTKALCMTKSYKALVFGNVAPAMLGREAEKNSWDLFAQQPCMTLSYKA